MIQDSINLYLNGNESIAAVYREIERILSRDQEKSKNYVLGEFEDDKEVDIELVKVHDSFYSAVELTYRRGPPLILLEEDELQNMIEKREFLKEVNGRVDVGIRIFSDRKDKSKIQPQLYINGVGHSLIGNVEKIDLSKKIIKISLVYYKTDNREGINFPYTYSIEKLKKLLFLCNELENYRQRHKPFNLRKPYYSHPVKRKSGKRRKNWKF